MELIFEDIRLDIARRQLMRDGAPVHVEPQVFDLLVLLAQSGGTVLTKDDLIEAVWGGLAVSDATINARISAARAAVGDSGKAQRIIRTLPRRGFQFCATLQGGDAPVQAPDAGTPAPMPRTQYTLSRDGHAIAWSHSGAGTPLIRIGHWLSHLERDRQSPIWSPLITRMEQQHHLVRYDLRGTGLSGRGAPLEGVDLFADDLESVADAAGHDRYHLFATSQAAAVAIAFAARAPERVDRLVILGGYAQGRIIRPAQEDTLDEATMLSMIRAGWGNPDSAFMQAMITLFAPDATRAQRDDLIAIQQATADGTTAYNLRKAIDRFDVTHLLSKVSAPTLVMHGREDAIHPFSQGQMIAAGIKDARFLPLDTRNHVLLPQDPVWETVVTELLAFLKA